MSGASELPVPINTLPGTSLSKSLSQWGGLGSYARLGPHGHALINAIRVVVQEVAAAQMQAAMKQLIIPRLELQLLL
jgi:hypothetical protein